MLLGLSVILAGALSSCGPKPLISPPLASTDLGGNSLIVASIRLPDPGAKGGAFILPSDGGGVRAKDAPLVSFIRPAFRLSTNDQVQGLPAWAKAARYDMNAEPDPSAPPHIAPGASTIPISNATLRAVLVQRFGLRGHWGTETRWSYVLRVYKGKERLKPASPQEVEAKPVGRASITRTAGEINAAVASMGTLAGALSYYLGLPVKDDTGLAKSYDFTLQWTPTPDAPDAAAFRAFRPGARPWPDLFVALEQQLGLKLVRVRGPVKVLVVDSIHPPTAN